MFAYGIFKVIYAPHKAFREIIKNPRYIGPILIMILFIASNMAFVYTVISKTYIEQTLPTAEQRDKWTENSTLWTTIVGEPPKENYIDYIEGTYYGNKSIEFSTVNNKQISMQLNYTESVSCSGPDDYKDLSLRIKWTSPSSSPENVTIYLFSGNSSDYFYYSLTENFSSSTDNVWNNITISLGTESWTSSSASSNWGDITGLKLEFAWPDVSDITLLVDGLFFRGVFRSPVERDAAKYLFNYSLLGFMQFIIKWVFLGGLLYIMIKVLGAKTVWRPSLILVGFALITMFIQGVINTATFSTLPRIYYRLEFMGGVSGESERAFNTILEETRLASQISSYVQIGVYVWTIALCALAIRLLAEFSWSKCVVVAIVAYFASVLMESFILGI